MVSVVSRVEADSPSSTPSSSSFETDQVLVRAKPCWASLLWASRRGSAATLSAEGGLRERSSGSVSIDAGKKEGASASARTHGPNVGQQRGTPPRIWSAARQQSSACVDSLRGAGRQAR